MSNNTRRDNRLIRIQTASERATERAERTDEEQLAKLVAEGHGHCEEAIRLQSRRHTLD